MTNNPSENIWNELMKTTKVGPSMESLIAQFFHCDGVVVEICLDHKFQWPQEGLNCESLTYEAAKILPKLSKVLFWVAS